MAHMLDHGTDKMSKEDSSWHDTKYDEPREEDIQRMLIHLYGQRRQSGQYIDRKYNSLQQELNIPNIKLTNNDAENIRRVRLGTQRLRDCLHTYLNTPYIRDWNDPKDIHNNHHKYNGHVSNVMVNYEHTVQGRNEFYHPHAHLYLIVYDIYNNKHAGKFYHNPSLSQLQHRWYQVLNQYHWNPNVFDMRRPINDRDMGCIMPGYVRTESKFNTIPMIRRGHHYVESIKGRRLLVPTDNLDSVRKMAYGEAGEFSKSFTHEVNYRHDLEHGYRDVNNPDDKGLYAVSRGLFSHGKRIFNKRELHGTEVHRLWNHVVNGDFDNTPIITYDFYQHRKVVAVPRVNRRAINDNYRRSRPVEHSYKVKEVSRNLPFPYPFKSINSYVESSHDTTHFNRSVNNTTTTNHQTRFNNHNHQNHDQQITRIKLLRLKRRRGLSQS